MIKTYTELFPFEVKKLELQAVLQSQIQNGTLIPVLAAVEINHVQKIRDYLPQVLNHPTDAGHVKILKVIEEVLIWIDLFTGEFKTMKGSILLSENESEALQMLTQELHGFKRQLMPASQILFGKRADLYPHLERIFLDTVERMQELTLSNAKKIVLEYEGLASEQYERILKNFQTYFSNLKQQAKKLIPFIQKHILQWDAEVLKTARAIYIPMQEDLPCSILFSAKGQAHLIFENMGQLLGSGADKLVLRIFSIPEGKIEALIKPLWMEEEEYKEEKQKIRLEDIWLETEILSTLKHKRGIVDLREKMTFEIDQELTLFLIEDFYWDGNLWNYLKYPIHLHIPSSKFSHALLKELFTDLLAGLSSIHQEGIIHHDLKPDNILLDFERKESKAVIVDFQLATSKTNQSRLARLRCIPKWTPPELAQIHVKHGLTLDAKETIAFIQDYIAATSEKMDIWAMGLTFYCMAACKLPFWFQDEETLESLPFEALVNTVTDEQLKLFELIAHLGKDWFREELAGSPFLPLLEKMLDPDPEHRFSATEALDLI